MWQDTTRWNERWEIPQETCRHSIMESEVGLFNFEGWMTNLLMWNLNFPLMDRIYVWGERKHNPFRPKGTAWVRTWKSENMGLGKLKRQDKHVTIMGIKIAVWVWGRTYRVVHPGERVRFSWQTTGATERKATGHRCFRNVLGQTGKSHACRRIPNLGMFFNYPTRVTECLSYCSSEMKRHRDQSNLEGRLVTVSESMMIMAEWQEAMVLEQ